MKKLFYLLVILALFITYGCKSEIKPTELTYYEYFDTIISIRLYDELKEDQLKLREKIAEELKFLHNKFDNFGDGDIAKLNREKRLSDQFLADILSQILKDEEITFYKTDISKGKLFKIWKNAIENAKMPNEKSIREANLLGGISSIDINGDLITLTGGAEVDLGMVAKGILNNILVDFIKNLGYNNFIIDSGGNITCVGAPSSSRNYYNTGIRDPFNASNEVDVLKMTDVSMVTSGSYERGVQVGDEYIHHIIDLKTARPYNGSVRSATIVGKDAYICDFLSTVTYLSSDKEVERIFSYYPDYYYYIIYEDKSIKVSEELKPYLNNYNGG